MSKGLKKIFITGISGFIGSALSDRFLEKFNVIGIDSNVKHETQNVILDFLDINDNENISKFVNIHKPDIIIHCAGIAHQKIGSIDSGEYLRVNSLATESLVNLFLAQRLQGVAA